jgi:hypothetical protein
MTRRLRLERGLERGLDHSPDGRAAGLMVLAGAVISLGFLELLRSPLQQLSSQAIQVLTLRTMVFAAPLAVNLLLLLQIGPDLLSAGPPREERRSGPADPPPAAWWHGAGPALLAGAFQSLVLTLYFLAAVLVVTVLSFAPLAPLRELAVLGGSLEPARFALSLLKGAAYGAAVVALCRRQRQLPREGARRMARTILEATALLAGLDLFLAISFDPLQITGG